MKRIETFSAPKKRETEVRNLEALLLKYDGTKLRQAVELLDAKGTLRGEKCHSPFSYLAVAADEVMLRIPTGAASSAPLPLTIPISPEENEMESLIAMARFETELKPGAQEEFVSGFIEREFPHGFLPPSRVTKTLAAKAWWKQRDCNHSTNLQLAV